MSISMWAALAGFIFQPLVPVIGALCMRAAECVVFIMAARRGLYGFIPWTALQPTLPYLLPYVLYVVFLLRAGVVEKRFPPPLRAHRPAVLLHGGLLVSPGARPRPIGAGDLLFNKEFVSCGRQMARPPRMDLRQRPGNALLLDLSKEMLTRGFKKPGPEESTRSFSRAFREMPSNFSAAFAKRTRKRILSMDSNCVGDENLRSFLKASPVSMGLLKDHDVLVAPAGSTCHVYSDQSPDRALEKFRDKDLQFGCFPVR